MINEMLITLKRGIEKLIKENIELKERIALLNEMLEDRENYIDELEQELEEIDDQKQRELEQKVWEHWQKIKDDIL